MFSVEIDDVVRFSHENVLKSLFELELWGKGVLSVSLYRHFHFFCLDG